MRRSTDAKESLMQVPAETQKQPARCSAQVEMMMCRERGAPCAAHPLALHTALTHNSCTRTCARRAAMPSTRQRRASTREHTKRIQPGGAHGQPPTQPAAATLQTSACPSLTQVSSQLIQASQQHTQQQGHEEAQTHRWQACNGDPPAREAPKRAKHKEHNRAVKTACMTTTHTTPRTPPTHPARQRMRAHTP